MEDRRIFDRIKAKLSLRFLDINSGREGRAETMDISANGLGLVTQGNLPVNTPLEIWLDIPDHHAPLYTYGKVVWSQGIADTNVQRVGVCLKKEELIGLARVLWAREKNKIYP